jgi:hypothetical protein
MRQTSTLAGGAALLTLAWLLAMPAAPAATGRAPSAPRANNQVRARPGVPQVGPGAFAAGQLPGRQAKGRLASAVPAQKAQPRRKAAGRLPRQFPQQAPSTALSQQQTALLLAINDVLRTLAGAQRMGLDLSGLNGLLNDLVQSLAQTQIQNQGQRIGQRRRHARHRRHRRGFGQGMMVVLIILGGNQQPSNNQLPLGNQLAGIMPQTGTGQLGGLNPLAFGLNPVRQQPLGQAPRAARPGVSKGSGTSVRVQGVVKAAGNRPPTRHAVVKLGGTMKAGGRVAAPQHHAAARGAVRQPQVHAGVSKPGRPATIHRAATGASHSTRARAPAPAPAKAGHRR